MRKPYDDFFRIGERIIGQAPTYFIADIGANHDGELERAKTLIALAKEAGADCAKFQHFRAESIVSRHGFAGYRSAHQAVWDKPVYETYEQCSIDREWNVTLAATCDEVGIDFMTTPYDFEAVSEIYPLVKAYKIGSGDITYLQLVDHIAKRGKPIFLATGASTILEVEDAVETVLQSNPHLCLMQCNTNYTGDLGNLGNVNLLVLQNYAKWWPRLPLGLSDHTHGHTTALGAIALGARVIEKHFTDDTLRQGPDHGFAMNPYQWRNMIVDARELESALGDGIKIVEDNEVESRVVQRRAIRLKRDLLAGEIVLAKDLEFLRPCPERALTPAQANQVLGRKLRRDLTHGDVITQYDVL